MSLDKQAFVGFAVALAIGMLIGIERERSKGQGPDREVAGVRTFTLISLVGAMSFSLGGMPLFAAFALVLGVLVAVGYRRTRDRDPGLTTEIAMLATFLLGALAIQQRLLAAAIAVVITIMLAARTRMHDWVRNVLTAEEVRDGLMLAAAALIILPLAPAEPIDPWGVVSVRKLWLLVVLVMAINGLGYVALRALGPKVGLSVAGLLSGFVSSTATIGAMGARTKEHPELHAGAVAGAAASSVATVVQLAIVVGLVHWPLLRDLWISLAAAGAVALAYGGFFTVRSARESVHDEAPRGRAFDPKTTVIFALVVGTTLLLSAALTRWLGERGLILATGISGFSDAHAAAISAATLAQSSHASTPVAVLAILVAFSTNAVSKSLVAFALGTRRYAFELFPGIVLMVGAAWLGWIATTLWLR